MDGLTGGVFLAGFALALGASEVGIGLLLAAPFLAQLGHVPAVLLLSRFGDCRRLAVGAFTAARLLIVLVAAVPFLPLPVSRLAVLTGLLVTSSALSAVGSAASQTWLRESVEPAGFGRFFGRRLTLLSLVSLLTLLLGGRFLDGWTAYGAGAQLGAFSILYGLGGLLGCVGALWLTRAPAPPPEALRTERGLSTLLRPLGDRNFRSLLAFLGIWGFGANLATPFLTVLLIRQYGVGFEQITLFAALSLLTGVAGMRLWAPLTDRFGNKPVLGINGLVYVGALVGWCLLPELPGPSFLMGAAGVYAALGFAGAGVEVAANGVAMKLADDDASTAYLASASTVRALATGFAPLVGGIAAAGLSTASLAMNLSLTAADGGIVLTPIHFYHHDFLFLASALLGLLAVNRFMRFEEVGDAPRKHVLRVAYRDVTTQVSLVAGLRPTGILSGPRGHRRAFRVFHTRAAVARRQRRRSRPVRHVRARA